jgi:hypothetical protein
MTMCGDGDDEEGGKEMKMPAKTNQTRKRQKNRRGIKLELS